MSSYKWYRDAITQMVLWRRKCQSSPVFLLGESHGQRSLEGYGPCSCTKSDTTEQLRISEIEVSSLSWTGGVLTKVTVVLSLEQASGCSRGWDGWMASLIQRTWVWASSRSRWRTGNPGVLPSVELQRVRHNWATEQQAAAYIHSMSVPQAQENDPQILECMTPDSPMSKTPLSHCARLSQDVGFALHCPPTTPGFLDFLVSLSQRLLWSPLLLLWWVVPSWGCLSEISRPIRGHLRSSIPVYSWWLQVLSHFRAVKVNFREGPCPQRAVQLT